MYIRWSEEWFQRGAPPHTRTRDPHGLCGPVNSCPSSALDFEPILDLLSRKNLLIELGNFIPLHKIVTQPEPTGNLSNLVAT